jgi:crossover junction endodeoxyribonuclease RusA
VRVCGGHLIPPEAASSPSTRGRTFNFVLPLPPSVNVLYRPGPGGAKLLTDEQREFRRDACTVVNIVRRGALPIAGRLEVSITLYFADRRPADIDNRLKAALDALAHGGAYFNDSQIDVLHVERVVRPGAAEECVVLVTEIPA